MATRIKRYEDKADRLDDLLARIEREMGADALIETRLFRRGGFLGLGGQRLVEVVATLELHDDALEKPAPGKQSSTAEQARREDESVESSPDTAAPEVGPELLKPEAETEPEQTTIDLSADAPVELEISDPAEEQAGTEEPEKVEPAAEDESQAQPTAEESAPEVSKPSPESKGREDIADLKSTINELKDHVLKLVAAQLKPGAAKGDNPPGEAEAAEPAPGTALNPLQLDPSVGIPPAQRQAYEQLVSWDISPYDAIDLLNNALGEHGEQQPLTCEALLQAVRSDICKNILLSNGVKLRKAPPAKVVALVGTTGVGKTTTIAKLAASFAFNHGKRVSLISLDNYRIAAAEQLRTYSDIIGLSFDVVFSRDEFDNVLTQRLHNDLVLVDTAGRSPNNTKQIFELKEVFSTHPPDEVHLVVSANVKSHDLSVILENFKPLGYDHVIVSKLDETRSLGGIYNINKLCQLPISYFTTGQSVPEDIRTASLKFIQTWIEQGKIT